MTISDKIFNFTVVCFIICPIQYAMSEMVGDYSLMWAACATVATVGLFDRLYGHLK